MFDTKLKALLREGEFWLLLLISLPGLVTGITTSVAAAWAAMHGVNVVYDPQAAMAALTGLPIVAYLAFGRQVARKGAAQGAGLVIATERTIIPHESNPDTTTRLDPALAEADTPDDDEAVYDFSTPLAPGDHPDDYAGGGH